MSSAVLGPGAGPAGSPSDSRLVEAIFIELASEHSQGKKLHGKRVYRWSFIMRLYHNIKNAVMTSVRLKRDAPMQLFAVNERTVRQW